MKKFGLILILGLMASDAWGALFRQDIGFYQSSQIWMGRELFDFTPKLDQTSSGGSVSTFYSVSSFAFDLGKNISEVRFHVKGAQSTMNNFSAATTSAGETQSGIAEVGLGYSRLLKKWDNQAVNWSIDFSAPGDTNLSPYKFNSITNGQTQLKLGVDYSLTYGIGSIAVGLSYAYRPGALQIVNVDDSGTRTELQLDVPDVIGLDVSLPFYFGTRYVGLLFNHEQALSGIDIGTPPFGEAAGKGRFPFPATREIRTIAGFIVGMVLGATSSIDATVNTQIDGRNTDKGVGVNIGYSLNFE